MSDWPTMRSDSAFAPPARSEHHRLVVTLDAGGEVRAVMLDGDSVWPGWFKIEWKGDGQLSAKVGGVRLSTRAGDDIVIERDEAV